MRKRHAALYLNGISEMRVHGESHVAKDKAVVTRWERHGQAMGELLGVFPPTGREVTVTGLTWVTSMRLLNPMDPVVVARSRDLDPIGDHTALAGEQLGAGP